MGCAALSNRQQTQPHPEQMRKPECKVSTSIFAHKQLKNW
jgi:hypothetical protein